MLFGALNWCSALYYLHYCHFWGGSSEEQKTQRSVIFGVLSISWQLNSLLLLETISAGGKYIMDIFQCWEKKNKIIQTGKPAVHFAVIRSLLCDQKMFEKY